MPHGKKFIQSAFASKLFAPVGISRLVAFRILFGLLLCYDIASLLLTDAAYQRFVKPGYIFTFIGFEFLQRLQGIGMYVYLSGMLVLALMIAAGFFYRFAIIAFTVLWAGIYFMQKTYYSHHTYLIFLCCFLLCFMPAHKYWSMDVWRNKSIQSFTCPQWIQWVFLMQIGIVYFYSALFKLYPDWLSGNFIQHVFLVRRLPLPGFLYHQQWFYTLISYSVIFFEFVIVPLLLYKPTRTLALFLSLAFHLFNSFVFSLGVFPYLCIILTVFFVDDKSLIKFFSRIGIDKAVENNQPSFKKSQRQLIVCCLTAYILMQVLLPLRSLLFSDNANWDEEGHRLSWRLKLRSKTGWINYKVYDSATHKTWTIDPAKKLSRAKVRKLAVMPDMVWQYAQEIKSEFAINGYPNAEVYAVGEASLNHHKKQPLVDSTVNLALEKWHPFMHSNWIVPYSNQ